MAGFRYWRLNFLHSGDSTFNQLAYFEMRDAVGGANLATNVARATMTAIGFAGDGTIDELFDPSASTFVLWQQSNNVTISYDFGLGGEVELMEVVLKARDASASRTPRFIAVERSSDNVNWSRVWLIYYTTWATSEQKVFERPFLPEACRYWAIAAVQIEAATAFLNLAEIEMREIPVDPVATGSGTPFITHEDPSFPASNSFDGDNATYSSNSATAYRDMIGYDFGNLTPKAIRLVQARSRQTVSFTRAPERGCVMKSNNFQDWEVVSNFSGLSWSSSELKTLYEAPFLVKDLIVRYGFVQYPSDIFTYIPDGGISETWSWKTTVSMAKSGKEQRLALLSIPRRSFQFTQTLPDERSRRAAESLIRNYLGRTVTLPLYNQMTRVTDWAYPGDSFIAFDADKTDIRDGEYAVAFNPYTQTFTRLRIGIVSPAGATLEDALTSAIGEGWFIMPVLETAMDENSGYNFGAVIGGFPIALRSMQRRSLSAPASPSRLTYFGSLPVIEDKPIATSDLPHVFDKGIETIDIGTSIPEQFSDQSNSYFSGARSWLIDSVDQYKWWAEFADYAKGRQKPFLLPTFREDLPIVGGPFSSPDQFITSNVDYLDNFAFASYKRLRIETSSAVYLVTATAVTDNGDGTITVDVSSSLSGSIEKVSYVNLARFNTDQIQIAHETNYSALTASVRSIDE
jgi:hypothetical protein